MASELRRVVMDSADPAALGRFWSALLDRPIAEQSADYVEVALCERVDLVLAAVRDSKAGKNRLHFDLASTSADHQAKVVQRAQMLGAAPVDIGQGAAPWVVLADPEGNEFCVLEPRDEYLANVPMAAVVIDALDPSGLATFWSQATGLPVTRSHAEYATVRRQSGFWLEFVRVTETKKAMNRLRFELSPVAEGDIPTEADRLQGYGAVVIQHDVELASLVDPEGNEFRVLTVP